MEPTDDLGLSAEFLADECIARDEDDYNGPRRARCTCGHLAARRDAEEYDYEYPEAECFAGCRGCDPVDFEGRPHGFGIETFEDPALHEANRVVRDHLDRTQGAYALVWWQNGSGAFAKMMPWRDELWRMTSKQNRRLTRAARRKWDRICDEAETHTEAVRLYRKWAGRAASKIAAR
jgi:hypothetical protein